MKISILTPTYNRENDLEELYNSLLINNNSGIDFEWLIMDDGSTDNTKIKVKNYIDQNIISIKYFYQQNQTFYLTMVASFQILFPSCYQV
mgnify:CR=1 FL=1